MTRSRTSLALSLLLLASGWAFLPGCSTLKKQFEELTGFMRCEFRLASVSGVSLMGISLQGKTRVSDFNLMDVAKLQRALSGGALPLDLTLNMEVRNPNGSSAGLSGMKWQLYLDGGLLTEGALEKAVRIAGKGTGAMPLGVRLDLNQVLSGKNFDSMLNLGLNIAGEGSRPTRLTMKVKPSVTVAGQTLPYPGWVSVGHSFGGK
jgi:hypothetical protein